MSKNESSCFSPLNGTSLRTREQGRGDEEKGSEYFFGDAGIWKGFACQQEFVLRFSCFCWGVLEGLGLQSFCFSEVRLMVEWKHPHV